MSACMVLPCYEFVTECKMCNCVKLLQSAEELEAKRIYEMEKPLSERLKVTRADAFDPLPPQLLRKVSVAATKRLKKVVVLQHCTKCVGTFHFIDPPENCDLAQHNFDYFPQSCNFCSGVQFLCNFGYFCQF